MFVYKISSLVPFFLLTTHHTYVQSIYYIYYFFVSTKLIFHGRLILLPYILIVSYMLCHIKVCSFIFLLSYTYKTINFKLHFFLKYVLLPSWLLLNMRLLYISFNSHFLYPYTFQLIEIQNVPLPPMTLYMFVTSLHYSCRHDSQP